MRKPLPTVPRPSPISRAALVVSLVPGSVPHPIVTASHPAFLADGSRPVKPFPFQTSNSQRVPYSQHHHITNFITFSLPPPPRRARVCATAPYKTRTRRSSPVAQSHSFDSCLTYSCPGTRRSLLRAPARALGACWFSSTLVFGEGDNNNQIEWEGVGYIR